MPKSYPLDWPENLPRSSSQEDSTFKTSFSRALEKLRHELRLLGATHILISCNLPTARDGWPDPRSRLRNDDPGVAVYWILNGKTHVIACDAWTRVEDNLHAIELTISADRAKARWGCSAIEARSMAAYLSLPAPPKPESWWEVLGVEQGQSLAVIEAIYRAKMKSIHPDTLSGDAAAAVRLNQAIESARREKSNVA